MNLGAAVDPDELPWPTGRLGPFVLKHGDMLLVGDGHGDIHGAGDGLFHDDTRILSRLVKGRLSDAPRPRGPVALVLHHPGPNGIRTVPRWCVPLPPLHQGTV